jgi:trehalose/maltose hydrolase-like predicted phosphorylase
MKQAPLTYTRTQLFISLFLLFLLSSTLAGAGPSFELTATEKDFSLYFPAYLANGYFTTSTSLRGTDATLSFMVGVMDYTPGDVPRPAALPSWAEMDYFDGAAWLNAAPVTASSLRNYRQTLDMYDGVFSTQYVFVSGSHSTRVVVTTFVSEDATHVGLTSLSLTPDFAGTVRLRFTLRPHAAPAHRFPLARVPRADLEKAIAEVGESVRATDPTAPERAGEWYPGYVEIQAFGGSEAQRLMWITGRAVGGPQIAEAAAIALPPGVALRGAKLQESPHLVSLEIALPVERGRTYTFTKYVAASREGWGGLKSAVINWAEEARREGFDSLLAKHQSAWHGLWKSDILVEGDPEVQRVIHSDLFSLLENSTVGTAWGMGACGFSPNYWAHVFWDEDSWDLPALLLLQPERAKSLAMFRYRTLPGAEARARAYGYRGAMYPWESDPQKGVESTDHDFVPFGAREMHVDADIAIGQWEYYLATGDAAWLRDYGYRVMRETAEFLASRATYNRERDRYEILHVCSPDEAYNDVPNDAFTNAVAQKALRAAVTAAGIVGQAPDPQWAEIAQKMYIPFSEKEQRHLDFDEAVPNTKKTWMGSSISWLSYPPLDLAMSPEVRRNDLNFEVKSLSELTPSASDINDMMTVMVGIEAAELGDEAESYKWLKFSNGGFLKPPFNVRSETARNNHLYILCTSAGFLENFLYGFTGLRLTDQGLTPVYAPVLPLAWKSVTIKGLKLRGQSFDLVLSRDEAGRVHLEKRPAAS